MDNEQPLRPEPAIRRVAGSRRVMYRADGTDASGDNAEARPRTSENTPESAPVRAAENTDRAWGDPDDSNDARLHRDRPPHWG